MNKILLLGLCILIIPFVCGFDAETINQPWGDIEITITYFGYEELFFIGGVVGVIPPGLPGGLLLPTPSSRRAFFIP